MVIGPKKSARMQNSERVKRNKIISCGLCLIAVVNEKVLETTFCLKTPSKD